MVCGLGATAVKIVLIILALSTAGFLVATIVLAVEKDNCSSSEDHSTVVPPTEPPPAEINYRLPGNIAPTAYFLSFSTESVYYFQVTILFLVLEDTNEIVLHASADMEIRSTSLLRIDPEGINTVLEVASPIKDAEGEFLILPVKQLLVAGNDYRLTILYTPNLDTQFGFYSYKTGNKEFFTTNLQPIYARHAFPCFDEPSFKAKFSLDISSSEGNRILSNMEVKMSNSTNQGAVRSTFEESVPMSPYQLAVFVSNFDSVTEIIEPLIGANFTTTIHAAKEDIGKVRFASELVGQLMEYFIDYFDVEYPLSKLDLVAVPEYSSLGGGGLGLLLMKDSYLLYDETADTSKDKQTVALNIARALAQLWMGDLATQKWWTDLWQYEGITIFLAYKALDSIFPNWGLMDQFLTSELYQALDVDTRLYSYYIGEPINAPEDVLERYGVFTSSKSAAVIRMFENRVGEEVFRNATRKFVKDTSYSNAPSYEFVDMLAESANSTALKRAVDTYVTQIGAPVLSVKKQLNQNYTGYVVIQEQFPANSSNQRANYYSKGTRWFVPMTFGYMNETNFTIARRSWYSETTDTYVIGIDKESKWMKFNMEQKGYYHVNYDDSSWKDLATALQADLEVMSSADRANLLYDSFSFAEVEPDIDYDNSLNFLKLLKNELDFAPWFVGSSSLTKLRTRLREANFINKFDEFLQSLVEAAYTYVGWTPDEDHLKNLLRMLILETACKFDYEPCLSDAKKQFDSWNYSKTNRPQPDIRQIVYSFGIASMKDESSWDQAWAAYIAESDVKEKRMLLKALAQVKSSSILRKYINSAWDLNNVAQKDYFVCLRAMVENPVGVPIVWGYLQTNWPGLVQRFGVEDLQLNEILLLVAEQFSNQERLFELTSFLNLHKDILESTRAKAVSVVAKNMQWVAKYKSDIEMWLLVNFNR